MTSKFKDSPSEGMKLLFLRTEDLHPSYPHAWSSHRDRLWRDGGLPNLRVVDYLYLMRLASYVLAQTLVLSIFFTHTQSLSILRRCSWSYNCLIVFQLGSGQGTQLQKCGVELREPQDQHGLVTTRLSLFSYRQKIWQFLEVIVITLTFQKSSRKYKILTIKERARRCGWQQVLQGRLTYLFIYCTSSDRSSQEGLFYDHR